MQTKRERKIIERIAEQYGPVIDLERAPGVMIEILREFGPNILEVLGEHSTSGGGLGTGGVGSSIAIAGPGSGGVTMEDLMRIILEMRQQIIELSERVTPLRQEIMKLSERINSRS
jgi:hypothetical protein